MRNAWRLIPFALTLAGASAAQEQNNSTFLEANILGIFYHELAHAIVDIEAIPIFGQEEDAADVFSIFMIHQLFEEEMAQELAYEASFGFWGEANLSEDEDDVAWWDVHGPDQQRYYNTVCIFFGGNPDQRHEFAKDLELPEDRAESCPFEYQQAEDSWGMILDEMVERGAGRTLRFRGNDDSFTAQILREEVAALNAELKLAKPVDILVESCGEANAFYDPSNRAIIFCSEFEDHLIALEKKLQ